MNEVTYLSIDDFFEEGEKLDAEMKAKEAVAFGEWILLNCEPIFCNGVHYHHLTVGASYKKYTTEQLYQIYLNESNRTTD